MELQRTFNFSFSYITKCTILKRHFLFVSSVGIKMAVFPMQFLILLMASLYIVKSFFSERCFVGCSLVNVYYKILETRTIQFVYDALLSVIARHKSNKKIPATA